MTGQRVPARQVRAWYDAHTITLYQAYSAEITERALTAGTFVAPFKLDRMTWIKPSFLWMMYRSGWATKPGQERVLAIARFGSARSLTGPSRSACPGRRPAAMSASGSSSSATSPAWSARSAPWYELRLENYLSWRCGLA